MSSRVYHDAPETKISCSDLLRKHHVCTVSKCYQWAPCHLLPLGRTYKLRLVIVTDGWGRVFRVGVCTHRSAGSFLTQWRPKGVLVTTHNSVIPHNTDKPCVCAARPSEQKLASPSAMRVSRHTHYLMLLPRFLRAAKFPP